MDKWIMSEVGERFEGYGVPSDLRKPAETKHSFSGRGTGEISMHGDG